MDDKAPGAFRTISEVADELDLPQHVLRFWESRFTDIKPMKRGGGRRYYRPDDIDLLRGIRHLLYGEGYTIRGVQRILREQGVEFVQSIWQEGAQPAPDASEDEEDFAEEAHDAEDQEEIEESDEPRGLRDRIGSLIGRDLNARTERPDRTEPPLHEAPTPRIDPGDRFGNASRGGPEQYAPPPRPATPKPAAVVSAPAGLSAEQSDRLQHVLDDLKECRKRIEAALAPADRQ